LNLETRIGIIVSTTKVHSIVAEDMALELMVTPLEVADCATMNTVHEAFDLFTGNSGIHTCRKKFITCCSLHLRHAFFRSVGHCH